MKTVVLTTDTKHHNYFIHHIDPEFVVYETKTEHSFTPEEETHLTHTPVFCDTYTFYNINESYFLLKEMKPDIIISFGTGKILEPILSLPGLKINVHRGILPNYRGLDSNLWAMYYKDFDNVGVTIHKLEKDYDTGDILAQNRILMTSFKYDSFLYITTVRATYMVEDIIQFPTNGTPQGKGKYFSHIPPDKKLTAIRHHEEYIG